MISHQSCQFFQSLLVIGHRASVTQFTFSVASLFLSDKPILWYWIAQRENWLNDESVTKKWKAILLEAKLDIIRIYWPKWVVMMKRIGYPGGSPSFQRAVIFMYVPALPCKIRSTRILTEVENRFLCWGYHSKDFFSDLFHFLHLNKHLWIIIGSNQFVVNARKLELGTVLQFKVSQQ